MRTAANVLRMTRVEINSISVKPFWPVNDFFNSADNPDSPRELKGLKDTIHACTYANCCRIVTVDGHSSASITRALLAQVSAHSKILRESVFDKGPLSWF
jgi:hypothetical protein